jgi:scyllo-inositol 2-dehydrogenase (NADP+)
MTGFNINSCVTPYKNTRLINSIGERMSKSKVVVIGYGFAGRCFHTYLVNLAEGLELYGVATSRSEARADVERRFGIKVFASFAEVLADDQVDLVVLATPNDLHAAHAIEAMAAGKHVVTDKPMCLSLAEADAMLAASKEHDRLLSVFQNRRWDGDFLTVKKVIEEGTLGTPFLIEMFWGQYGAPGGWRGDAEHGGGKFLDLGTHLVDQALQLVDAPVEQVYARFHSPPGWERDIEAHAMATITFANGVEARVENSSLAKKAKPRWYVLGTQGALVKEGLDPQERAMIVEDIDSAREAPEHRARLFTEVAGRPAETVIDSVPGRWRSFYENIAEALEDRSKLAITPESVRAAFAVIAAARESATTGQVVRLA